MKPTLPPDTLIDIAHILFHTHPLDLSTLSALSRTHKSVLHPIQKLIFAQLDLRTGPRVHERCSLLRAALEGSPHLAGYVRSVRITDIAGGWSEGADVPPWTPSNGHLPYILSCLPTPHAFEFTAPLQPITWDTFSDDFCTSLFRLFTRPTLASLSITGVKDLPAALFARSQGLKHLCLRNGTIFITTLPGYYATLGLSDLTKPISNLDQLRLSSPTQLHSLELVDMGNLEFLLDSPNRPAEFTFNRLLADHDAHAEFLLDRETLFPDFSALRRISVRQCSFPEVANTWKIIVKARERMEELSWEFVYGRSPGCDSASLHTLPHLTHLSIRITVPAMDVYHPFRGFTPTHPLAPLLKLLSSSLPPPPPPPSQSTSSQTSSPSATRPEPTPCGVTHITITLDTTVFSTIPPKIHALFAPDPAWDELRSLLKSEEHFPKLDEVRVGIVVRRVNASHSDGGEGERQGEGEREETEGEKEEREVREVVKGFEGFVGGVLVLGDELEEGAVGEGQGEGERRERERRENGKGREEGKRRVRVVVGSELAE